MSESNKRLLALDTFRGATIMLMILVNNPGTWGHIYSPLRHAKWHGCTLTDLVFPFFLFIMGVAMRFTFEKYEICNRYGPLFKKVLSRTATIFILGLILNAFPFNQARLGLVLIKNIRSFAAHCPILLISKYYCNSARY